MKQLALPNLHDASIEGFSFDSDTARLIIDFWKAALDKEPAIQVKLIFSGITNAKVIEQLAQRIRVTLNKEKRSMLGYRVDNLSYYSPLLNDAGLHLALDIDHLGILRIDCMKISIHHGEQQVKDDFNR